MEGSSQGQGWLLDLDLWRTSVRRRLYDEQKVYNLRNRRQLQFTSIPTITPPTGSKRRRAYIENPIHVALRLRIEFETMNNPSQGRLAQHHGVNRTRICQYLRLLDLPEEIVRFIAAKENEEHVSHITEGAIRELLRLQSGYEIDREFRNMLAQADERAEAAFRRWCYREIT